MKGVRGEIKTLNAVVQRHRRGKTFRISPPPSVPLPEWSPHHTAVCHPSGNPCCSGATCPHRLAELGAEGEAGDPVGTRQPPPSEDRLLSSGAALWAHGGAGGLLGKSSSAACHLSRHRLALEVSDACALRGIWAAQVHWFPTAGADHHYLTNDLTLLEVRSLTQSPWAKVKVSAGCTPSGGSGGQSVSCW